jgi:tRNA(Arg) A34 adenosine deaminase TadA
MDRLKATAKGWQRAPGLDDDAQRRDERHACDVDATRRKSLRSAAGLLLGAIAAPVSARDPLPEIVQPRAAGPEGLMERAFEMRRRAIERGDQPYGAVIAKGGRIVGEGVSAVVTDRDPTAHAEMQAIRDAARRLGTSDLSGCRMYGTSRACPMCEAGAYWARLAGMYYGASIVDAGAPRLP